MSLLLSICNSHLIKAWPIANIIPPAKSEGRNSLSEKEKIKQQMPPVFKM